MQTPDDGQKTIVSSVLRCIPDDLRILFSPKFLFPSIVILLFSLAALDLTARLLDGKRSPLTHTLERSVAILSISDSFESYESAILGALSEKKASPEDFDAASKRFEVFRSEIDSFASAGWRGMEDPEADSLILGIRDDAVYIDYILKKREGMRPEAFAEEVKEKNAGVRARLQSLKTRFVEKDEEGAAALDARHNRILISIFVMGLSGFVLIVFLVDRLANLERVDSERHRALGLAEQRVASMEAARDGMMITAGDGTISYANRAVLLDCRCPEGESLSGARWSGLYPRDQIGVFKNFIVPDVEEKGVWSGQVTALRRDGTTFPQDLSITRLADGGAIWVMRDVSGQVEAEKLSQRRLAAIEAAGDGIGIAGADGKLSYMNRALMRLHGILSEDEAIYLGESWEFLYSGKGGARISENVRLALSEDGFWQGETKITRRDGEHVWAEMTLTILPDGGVVCTARDVTERKRAEVEKEDLREQFFQAQKMEAIGRLAGGIAHDFNNILAAIMGYAEFLAEDLEKDPDKRKFAEGILQAGTQGRHLVDQMLSFSRRRETSRDVLDITRAVRETVSILRASLPKTIEVEEEFEMDRALVEANATQIAQAVMNLCVNAKDAMEDEHGTLVIGLSYVEADEGLYEDMLADILPEKDAIPPIRLHEIEPGHACLEMGTLVRGRRYVQLGVADTGTGMSYAIMQHIFEPFFTTKAVDKGTGLGLANVHGVVVAHQGALVVDSVLGEGTRFELFFPVAEDAQDGMLPVADAEGAEEKALPPRGGKVLVVEDQEQVRDMMVTMLSRMGYESHICESGIDALYHLRENKNIYDLVVTDHNMPKMTGMELADQAAIEIPGLPFILVTGYSKESLDSDMSEHVSIRAVLRKPVDRKEFSRKIESVLSESRGRERVAKKAG